MESERIEKERVQDKLPEQLRKRVLERAQFRKFLESKPNRALMIWDN